MQKLISRMLPVAILLGASMVSCSDDKDTLQVTYEPPTHRVAVTELQRTQASFDIEAPQAADYAYIIAEKGDEPITDAEEIFKNGQSGQLEDGVAKATTFDIEGSKDYVVYSAVRRINPYVYSEVIATDLSTNIPYTDLATLDKVGLTDVAYHLEIPEGVDSIKHMVIKEADYIAIRGIIGSLGEINERLYLKVFGNIAKQSDDISLDKLSIFAFGSHSIIHTGTTYYLMAGVVTEDGDIDPETFQLTKFDTRTAGESPYNIDVAVETSSNQAIVSVIPDPEIVEYRMLVESRAEFDFALAEGEAQQRNIIVNFWDDEENTPKRVHTGAIEYKALGLIPNSEYVVGIVGYDAERREKFIRFDFVTGEPTGPKPTLTVTEAEPEVAAPWSTKAFHVSGTHLEEVRYGFFIKSQIDQLLRNGSSLTNILRANGEYCSASQVAEMNGEGVVFETNALQPQTEYMFGVYARNDEYVTTVATAVFTTEETPLLGGNVRKNMPGKYIATTTIDEDGTPASFPVTISTGIDATTIAEYKDQNRLVCYGFGPESSCPYYSPTDLIDAGLSMDDAYKYYGPKWFIEFTSDTEMKVPAPDPSYGSNYKWFMGYDKDASKAYVLWGAAIHASNGRDNLRQGDSYPVEVSEDGNTVTIKGSELSRFLTYYPAMAIPPTGWGNPTILFRCYSDLVLTRDESESAAKAYTRTAPLVAPRILSGRVGSASIKNGRAETAAKFHN